MFPKNPPNENIFVIAEIGQNHQGDLGRAREYIKIFAGAGANAVKFQTRNNKYLFSEDAYKASYASENAFADTYGAHREKLELKPDWLYILKEDCLKYGVKFISTPFDEPSLDLLSNVSVDAFKIASFDLGNLPFIKRIAERGKPIIMSVGGGKLDQIRSSVDIIQNFNVELAILHCVSEYPCEANRLGLNSIEILLKEFPSCAIGSSDHFSGILSGPVAYMKGARVFEKHVTLNRSLKGTDHSFALEPEGFRKFVRDIKRVPLMMDPKPSNELGSEYVFKKLGKSIIARVNIKKGQQISIDELSGRIFQQQYIPVRESLKIINSISTRDILAGEPIKQGDFLTKNYD
jgi:sialic acid synthase